MGLSTSTRPAAPGLRVAAVVLALEGVALLAFAALQLMQINGSASIAAAGVAFAGYAVILLLIARGVRRGRRWSRGPAVVSQLLQLPIAWVLYTGPTAWVAGALGVSAAVALVSLLLPSSTAVFVRPSLPPESGRV